jgi:GNAT superfamily N-acetyltransferase
VSEVQIRSATTDEVRLVQLRRGVDELALRLAMEFAEQGGVFAALDEGEAIGLAISRVAPQERFVGDLFVEASFRGQSIGSRLLDEAYADAGDAVRTFGFDARDRASLAMALRRGLAARETLLRMAGAIPREEALAAMAAGHYRFDVDAIDPLVHAFALDALDRETRGAFHPQDHARFTREATGRAFFLDGDFVAYAYCWPDGRIGPLASTSAAYLVQLFAFALVTLQRTYGASWCTALVPASNVRVARAALRVGLLIEEQTLLASDGPPCDLSRYVAYHGLLP